MMTDIKLIAVDLDGTLLTSQKELTQRTKTALEMAASNGMEIVPATGRFYHAIPETVRELPFIRYAITINGAQVYDIYSHCTIYSAEITTTDVLSILDYLDTLPVIYDCYAEGWGYISADMQEIAESYISNPYTLRSIHLLRTVVPSLKKFIQEQFPCIQKLQIYTKDIQYQERLFHEISVRYPDFAISSSQPNNIEINCAQANKGSALLALAKRLNIGPMQMMAFGDGVNDLQMLCNVGTGIAMGNACANLKAAADFVTLDCDSDGLALVIEHLCC